MRRALTALAAIALVLGVAPSTAAASGGSDIVKTIFIHYRAAPTVDLARGAHAPGVCPDATTCTDYKWRGNKWPSTTVSYELNAGGVSGASTAVAAAFAAWTHAVADHGGTLSVSASTGTTSCATAGTVRNQVDQICWRDLTSSYPNAIAVTFVWSSRSTKQIVEADTVFNSGAGFSWSYHDPGSCLTYGSCNTDSGASGTYDIRDIGTHEFGHFLALLSDLYTTSRDSQLTMYGYGSTGETKKDSLAKGDCLGITAAYGGTCP